jgi:hypothetical protein
MLARQRRGLRYLYLYESEILMRNYTIRLMTLVTLACLALLALTACGGEAPTPTPEPSNTPAPTDTPAPTNTPAPTVDVNSLGVPELEATLTFLEGRLADAEARAAGASSAGEESAVDQDIRRYEGQIEDVEELIANAGGSAEEEADTDADEAVEETDEEANDETPADEADEEAAAESDVTLTLAGDFAEAQDWTWDEIEALGTTTVTAAGPREDDAEAEYTGVSLTALFEAAGLGEDAATLVLTAADDFSAEVEAADAAACEDCLVVLEDGSLRLVMPGLASNAWIRDLVSIEAQ